MILPKCSINIASTLFIPPQPLFCGDLGLPGKQNVWDCLLYHDLGSYLDKNCQYTTLTNLKDCLNCCFSKKIITYGVPANTCNHSHTYQNYFYTIKGFSNQKGWEAFA